MTSLEMTDPGKDSTDIHLKAEPAGESKAEAGGEGSAVQEYDRRGVLLPARARVGGIITPQ